MPRIPFRDLVVCLFTGMLVTACGGIPDETLDSAGAEPLETQQAALCSGLYVTDLSLNGISTYHGEMAGNGTWTASTSANAARLEFYVDRVLHGVSEEVGTTDPSGSLSGSWHFSAMNIACGPRTFEVRAYPMVITSTGSRTICYQGIAWHFRYVTEACPPPASSLNCVRSAPFSTVSCSGQAWDGTPPYTAYWKVGQDGTWFEGPMSRALLPRTIIALRVKDAAGNWSVGMSCDCQVKPCSCN